jgi:hypothetical protein
MNSNEMSVCIGFIENKYPDVYADMKRHLESYRKFMKAETLKWIDLQKSNPDLEIPESIQQIIMGSPDSLFDFSE